MHPSRHLQSPATILLAVVLAAPGAAFAYGTSDAIRDCESRIRGEYGISDLRDASAVQLNDSEKHFKVEGKAKVDGEKYHWTCEVKNRHVTAAEYDGPRPEGMSNAAKLAVGAAAAIAAGIAVSESNKHGGEGHSGSGGSGAAGLQDLVGARASSGEAQLESRGYIYASGEQGGGSAYTNWRKGSHCVTVRTVDGHYKSIVDVTMLDCQ
jgi:hypothetical protein